jgi:hypothetical protein
MLSLVLYPKCAHFASLSLPTKYWGPERRMPLSRSMTITRIVSH